MISKIQGSSGAWICAILYIFEKNINLRKYAVLANPISRYRSENMYFKIWETMHRIHYVSSITIARIMFNCYCNWSIFSLLIEELPISFVSKFFPTLIKTGSNKTKNTFLLQIWIMTSFFFLWTLRKFSLNTKIFCLSWKIFYIEDCFRKKG